MIYSTIYKKVLNFEKRTSCPDHRIQVSGDKREDSSHFQPIEARSTRNIDGRVWTSLSELVKIEQKLDQHPVKFISRNHIMAKQYGELFFALALVVESEHGVRARQNILLSFIYFDIDHFINICKK